MFICIATFRNFQAVIENYKNSHTVHSGQDKKIYDFLRKNKLKQHQSFEFRLFPLD